MTRYSGFLHKIRTILEAKNSSHRGNRSMHLDFHLLEVAILSIVLLAIFFLPILQCTLTSMRVNRQTSGGSEYWESLYCARGGQQNLDAASQSTRRVVND